MAKQQSDTSASCPCVHAVRQIELIGVPLVEGEEITSLNQTATEGRNGHYNLLAYQTLKLRIGLSDNIDRNTEHRYQHLITSTGNRRHIIKLWFVDSCHIPPSVLWMSESKPAQGNLGST